MSMFPSRGVSLIVLALVLYSQRVVCDVKRVLDAEPEGTDEEHFYIATKKDRPTEMDPQTYPIIRLNTIFKEKGAKGVKFQNPFPCTGIVLGKGKSGGNCVVTSRWCLNPAPGMPRSKDWENAPPKNISREKVELFGGPEGRLIAEADPSSVKENPFGLAIVKVKSKLASIPMDRVFTFSNKLKDGEGDRPPGGVKGGDKARVVAYRYGRTPPERKAEDVKISSVVPGSEGYWRTEEEKKAYATPVKDPAKEKATITLRNPSDDIWIDHLPRDREHGTPMSTMICGAPLITGYPGDMRIHGVASMACYGGRVIAPPHVVNDRCQTYFSSFAYQQEWLAQTMTDLGCE